LRGNDKLDCFVAHAPRNDGRDKQKSAARRGAFSFQRMPLRNYEARVASQRPEHVMLEDLPLHCPEPELAESLPLPLAF